MTGSLSDVVQPIPWRKLAPILLFRISDAVVYSVIFPMVTDMITSFDVAPDRIGLYAGLGEGVLMLTEAMAATTWARLADRYGRRPCMLLGFMGSVGAAAAVGFSKGVWSVVLWRAIFGLNPCGVISRIQVGEISHPTNRARIFAISSPAFSTGVMLGGLIGGQLTRPYGRLPKSLGGEAEIWKEWPYALPCVVSAMLGVLCILIGYFCLGETRAVPLLSSKLDGAKISNRLAATVRVPNFLLITAVFCAFQLTTFAWSGIFTVITYTEVERGGYGLPITTIGLLFSIGSAMYILLAPMALPYLTKKFGEARALMFIFLSWIILALTIPLAQYSARNARWVMWFILVFQLLAGDFGNFGWPMCDLLSMNAFDDYPELLATGSAITLIAGASGRALGPTIFGWLYSLSTQFPEATLGRQMPWICLLVVCAPPLVCARLLPRVSSEVDDLENLPMLEQEAVAANNEPPYSESRSETSPGEN